MFFRRISYFRCPKDLCRGLGGTVDYVVVVANSRGDGSFDSIIFAASALSGLRATFRWSTVKEGICGLTRKCLQRFCRTICSNSDSEIWSASAEENTFGRDRPRKSNMGRVKKSTREVEPANWDPEGADLDGISNLPCQGAKLGGVQTCNLQAVVEISSYARHAHIETFPRQRTC